MQACLFYYVYFCTQSFLCLATVLNTGADFPKVPPSSSIFQSQLSLNGLRGGQGRTLGKALLSQHIRAAPSPGAEPPRLCWIPSTQMFQVKACDLESYGKSILQKILLFYFQDMN